MSQQRKKMIADVVPAGGFYSDSFTVPHNERWHITRAIFIYRGLPKTSNLVIFRGGDLSIGNIAWVSDGNPGQFQLPGEGGLVLTAYVVNPSCPISFDEGESVGWSFTGLVTLAGNNYAVIFYYEVETIREQPKTITKRGELEAGEAWNPDDAGEDPETQLHGAGVITQEW